MCDVGAIFVCVMWGLCVCVWCGGRGAMYVVAHVDTYFKAISMNFFSLFISFIVAVLLLIYREIYKYVRHIFVYASVY